MPHDFPACRAVLDQEALALFDQLLATTAPAARMGRLTALSSQGLLPAFLPDLFRLEGLRRSLPAVQVMPAGELRQRRLNPSLHLLAVAWQGLPAMLDLAPSPPPRPAAGSFVLLWHDPDSGRLRVEEASATDLLALKLMVDDQDPALDREALPAHLLADLIQHGLARGLIVQPPSALRRQFASPSAPGLGKDFLSARTFTLQWHITQACDLHCRHCYDRQSRATVDLKAGLAILDQLQQFVAERQVHGQVTFTGGNPLLHPHFKDLYRGAAERGLAVAILGNPAPRRELEALVAMAPPAFYQVSLEGLAAHNDHIRGPGHFARVITFLAELRELGIYSMVMLTLTQDNQGQVLALAELLRDKADLFTFNRLAKVGEGARLAGAGVESYRGFLAEYLKAAAANPGLGLKDNLANLLLAEQGLPLFGGCTGHGCGAAFNFLAVLADGEVHACRKFPSPIGHLGSSTLAALYDSEQATAYRQGSAACAGCPIRPACGGCLAVSHGLGLDPLQARDPYCWRQQDDADQASTASAFSM